MVAITITAALSVVAQSVSSRPAAGAKKTGVVKPGTFTGIKDAVNAGIVQGVAPFPEGRASALHAPSLPPPPSPKLPLSWSPPRSPPPPSSPLTRPRHRRLRLFPRRFRLTALTFPTFALALPLLSPPPLSPPPTSPPPLRDQHSLTPLAGGVGDVALSMLERRAIAGSVGGREVAAAQVPARAPHL